jgi:glycosyltransferase involved in cell wall biosynthesis
VNSLQSSPAPTTPDLSLVIPCYNEEDIVAYTVHRLLRVFERAGYRLELVTVDNGSSDGTGAILRELAGRGTSVVYHRVEKNEGYGHGVLSGMPRCTAPWVGLIPADAQVDAEDVVRLYEMAALSGENVVAKVRRRFRMDGAIRKVVTFGYNMFIRLLWPGLGWDVNATPKILPRHLAAAMQLTSKGWALDPEIMIKARYIGVRVIELNILSRERCIGTSKIRTDAMWDLIRSLVGFRFSRQLRQLRAEWKDRLPARHQSGPGPLALPGQPRG